MDFKASRSGLNEELALTDESITMTIDGWAFRLRIPQSASPHPVMVLLHGWTGDENSMWIFASRFPKDYLLILPRGLYSAPFNGFGWHPRIKGDESTVEDFKPSISRLLNILTPGNFPQGDFGSINLAGFSQGAALAYSFALLHPEHVSTVAGLSGFLPEGIDPIVDALPLEGKKVFMAHGTRDDLVPVDKARLAARTMERAGAQVTYCEDNVGHKLSLNCFRGLQSFYDGLHC